jgi:hypothetical protein
MQNSLEFQGELRSAHDYFRQHNLEEDAATLREIVAMATSESGYDFTRLLSEG